MLLSVRALLRNTVCPSVWQWAAAPRAAYKLPQVMAASIHVGAATLAIALPPRRSLATMEPAPSPSLASPEDLRRLASTAFLIDLRTPPEVLANPSPPETSLVWDYNASSEVPVANLPADKSTPIILF